MIAGLELVNDQGLEIKYRILQEIKKISYIWDYKITNQKVKSRRVLKSL